MRLFSNFSPDFFFSFCLRCRNISGHFDEKQIFCQIFSAKSLYSTLWNFMDRVIAYIIVSANMPGRTNKAADILSKLGTLIAWLVSSETKSHRFDCQNSRFIIAVDIFKEYPKRHKKTTAKTENLMAQLQANDTLQTLSANLSKIFKSASPKESIELFALKRVPEN